MVYDTFLAHMWAVYLLMPTDSGSVGSDSISSYMFSSERWSSPSFTYWSLSSTIIPEPLSGLLLASGCLLALSV